MKVQLLLLLGFLTSITSYCQQNLRGLLDSAITPGTVVFKTPLKTLYLDKDDMWDYRLNMQYFKERFDTTIILEIIANSTHIDSSKWTEREMPNVILIENKTDRISKREIKAALKKVQPSLASDFTNFNDSPVKDRNVLSYSKPVFDKSGNYAVIAYRASRGGGAIIYHFVNNHWLELGDLVNWKV